MKKEQKQKVAPTLLNSREMKYFENSDRIDTKKILNFLYKKKPKTCVNSGLRSTAQDNILCGVRNTAIVDDNYLLRQIAKLKAQGGYLFEVATILYHSGCRVSEVLNLHTADVLQDNSLVIRGLKGSNDRIIKVPGIDKFLNRMRLKDMFLFEGYNRYFIYREFKKVGLSKNFGNHQNNSVTHLFRHQKIRTLRKQGLSNDLISKYIGHKNEKNTENY